MILKSLSLIFLHSPYNLILLHTLWYVMRHGCISVHLSSPVEFSSRYVLISYLMLIKLPVFIKSLSVCYHVKFLLWLITDLDGLCPQFKPTVPVVLRAENVHTVCNHVMKKQNLLQVCFATENVPHKGSHSLQWFNWKIVSQLVANRSSRALWI